jgi:cytoskeletal protein CcmA (bactofilin family)
VTRAVEIPGTAGFKGSNRCPIAVVDAGATLGYRRDSRERPIPGAASEKENAARSRTNQTGKGFTVADSTGVIGKGIEIRGNLSGAGDLVIEGRVEGEISLKNTLTIEESGEVQADVELESIVVNGKMNGNIAASDRVSISSTAKVVGDIKAPRVVIEDGARFKGSIEMDVKLPEGL